MLPAKSEMVQMDHPIKPSEKWLVFKEGNSPHNLFIDLVSANADWYEGYYVYSLATGNLYRYLSSYTSNDAYQHHWKRVLKDKIPNWLSLQLILIGKHYEFK